LFFVLSITQDYYSMDPICCWFDWFVICFVTLLKNCWIMDECVGDKRSFSFTESCLYFDFFEEESDRPKKNKKFRSGFGIYVWVWQKLKRRVAVLSMNFRWKWSMKVTCLSSQSLKNNIINTNWLTLFYLIVQVNSSLWIHRECRKLTRAPLRLHYHSMRCYGSRYSLFLFLLILDYKFVVFDSLYIPSNIFWCTGKITGFNL